MMRVNILECSQTVTHGSSTDVYGFPDLIITIVNSSPESRKPSCRSRVGLQLNLSFISMLCSRLLNARYRD